MKKLIHDGKLEVRVYLGERLHAKAYILMAKNRTSGKSYGIVGSSNFTYSGLAQNSELNLQTLHQADINKLLDWFENLWKDAKDFQNNYKEIIDACWVSDNYTQHDVFLKALYHEHKEKLETPDDASTIWKKTLPPLHIFQDDAVGQGLVMFERYGGVILGDVVGLGKTYVGAALLRYLSEIKRYYPLIVCPPHLVDMWEEFCENFQVDAKVLSMGKLRRSDFDLVDNIKYSRRDLVLIDESHHFKTGKSTRQYENLNNFMKRQAAKAILLTATPYANKPSDIKNQIMLFHANENETEIPVSDGNLKKFFDEEKDGKKNLSEILRHIMIRRTRRYLIKHWGKKDERGNDYLIGEKGQKVYFPKIKMENLRYDINKVYQNNYNSIMEHFEDVNTNPSAIKFARYHAGHYLKEEFADDPIYQDLLDKKGITAALMKIIILKRLDSSLEAFKRTINSMTSLHHIFLEMLEKGIIPIGKGSNTELRESLKYEGDFIEDAKQLEDLANRIREGQSETGNLYNPEAFHIEEWKNAIKDDIVQFKKIQKIIEPLRWEKDDKLQKIQKLLDNLKGNKVLVFSEYADTTKYLNNHIKWRGIKTEVNSDTKNKMSAVRKFDPKNNPGGDEVQKKDEITLLIATDVLSEGVNLQAGSIVINYDFFWSPVRLIQRQGRIDRIGSKHDKIRIFNFLPDKDVEEKLHIHEIVKRKIDEIHRSIGMDSQILESQEVINEDDPYAVYEKGFEEASETFGGPSELEPSKFESIITKIKLDEPDIWNKFSKEIPNGIRCSEGDEKDGKLLICCESGTIRHYYVIDKDGTAEQIKAEDALAKLEVKEGTPTSKFPENYNELVTYGFDTFKSALKQIKAGTGFVKQTKEQRSALKKLQEISEKAQNQSKQKQKEISDLKKGFKLKLNDALSKELRDIVRYDNSDEEFLEKLFDLYNAFRLWKNVQTEDDEWIQEPRILYSKYYFERN